MGLCVHLGAMISCSFGAAPATLVATQAPTVMIEGVPAANIMDMAPMTNIPTFAMCSSLANPQVAAATSAALGVLTPMPCTPVPAGPWAPGAAKTMIGKMPALVTGSQAMCAWGGVIQITNPGCTKTQAN